MAQLLCDSNINFTAASWKVIDSTSYLNSETSNATVTTSFVASSTFTTGAITIEGIMIKLNHILSNTGTITVELYNSTAAASVVGATLTVNVSALPQQLISSGCQGFLYFKFGTPVLLLAATLYSVRVKTSVSSTISLAVSSGTNWSRCLVTSSTAAPAVSDNLFIAAPYITTTAPSVITCTLNNTSSTIFGSVEMAAYSKMVLENNSATSYKLRIANTGLFITSLNSVVEFGTPSSRIDATSSFLLEMLSTGTATNGINVRHLSKFTMYGSQVTRTAKLIANSSVGATSLTTNISTNWKNGDNIIFANTIRSASANSLCEKKTLTADASGTNLTISPMSNAKSGTSPTQCDMGNLTSNAKIYGSSTTSTIYILIGVNTAGCVSNFDVDNVEFRNLGGTVLTKYGIVINGQSLSSLINITNCSFYDGFTTSGAYIYIPNGGDTFNILNNVFYNGNVGLILGITNFNGTKKANNNLFIAQNNRGLFLTFYTLANYKFEVKNNIVSGAVYNAIDISTMFGLTDEIDGNISYGNQGLGYYLNASNSILLNMISYLNNGNGIFSDRSNNNKYIGGTLFGNSGTNLTISGGDVLITNFDIQSNTTYTTTYGINGGAVNNPSAINIIFNNCTIGTTRSHNIASIILIQEPYLINFINCSFGDSTIYTLNNGVFGSSKVGIQRKNGITGNHITYKGYGTLINDTVIFDTSPSSMRLTPTSPTIKLKSTVFPVSVASGSIATVSIKVRKSVIGDGTAYDGNQPRLILKANASAHASAYNSDIVAATATNAANGAWETLSYTLPSAVTDNVGMEFYVDCDGTTGWVNVDTFVSNNNNSMTYYMNGEPVQDISSAGTTETFYTFIT